MTDENSDIRDLDPCLPDEYLRGYALGKVTKQGLRAIIEAHVGLCSECAAKVRSFRHQKLSPDELLEKQMASLRQRQEAVKRQQAQGPRPGTIWRTVPWTKSDQSGPLVLVLSYTDTAEKKFLTVAEVSENISQAIETDMILDPQESGLKFRCMVRAGNIFVMDPHNLDKFAAELPHPLTKTVLEFCRLGECFDDRVPLSQFVFLRDAEGNKLMRRKGIISGIQVTGNDDPRLVTATRSKHLCEYLHVADRQSKKPESRPIDKRYLTSLLTGLVSELSMWGNLLITPSKPAYAGPVFTESASLRTDWKEPDPPKVEIKREVKPGPTRKQVRLRQPEQRQFKHGDQIRLSVTSPEDGHLVVVHYDEKSGELEIVFPVPETGFTTVTSDQEIRIERQLVNPPGRYGFKVIFARKRLLPSSDGTVSSGEQNLQDLMALVERIEELGAQEWREATFEYEIVKKRFFSRWFS